MSPRLVLIADDLTGALDSAAPFADAGLRVFVAVRPEAVALALARGGDVVAISTRSREIPPEAARGAVARVLAALPVGVRLFKKVDSRLKGQIAAELAAFAAGSVLMVPAIPAFGRIVRDGWLSGFGLADPIAVASVLGGRQAVIPDTVTDDDMAAAVAGRAGLIVGARGAAVALARQMASGAADEGAKRLALPMLMAVGSVDPITLEQVARLRAARPDLGYLAAPDGRISGESAAPLALVQAVPGPGAGGGEVARALAAGLVARAQGRRCLLLTGGATAEAALDALGVDVLALGGDLMPGLPVADGGGWRIVTKSGGFGGPDVLARLAEMAENAG